MKNRDDCFKHIDTSLTLLIAPRRQRELQNGYMTRRLKSTLASGIVLGSALMLFTNIAEAQLTDITQTTPNVPGGAIAKSLQQQIGTSQGDISTPGSSSYTIVRDPARAIRRGRQLFQRKFTFNQGAGPRVNDDSNGNVQDNPAFGAGLVDSCAGCHGRPRGSAGFGGVVATRPDSRDAPHLFGLGLKEMLANEITEDLRAIRAQAIQQAANKNVVTLQLKSKGINYGFIKALPNGTVDTSLVDGVDPDLRVRPFFAQGGEFSIRAFAVGAFKDEMGLEAVDALLCAASDPVHPVKTVSVTGFVFDPALDKIKRPPTCSKTEDNDGDGVANEIDVALIDYMEFYLLNYFKPGTGELSKNTEKRGVKLLERTGCTVCHIQNLTINRDLRIADVETEFDPQRGIFNRLFARATTLFTAVNDGRPFPLLLAQEQPFIVRNIFTDFKRHDLGPAFHERNYDGTLQTKFVTTPLWGVGSTAPYGHDGRSINLKEVILRHGGEALEARNRFAQLDEKSQKIIMDYLSALIIFPPDDTASTLNPGVPGTTSPQDPAQHGSIALSVLFQIPDEGTE
jgi:Di-haem oxidoreductase, putative peroxidase